MRFDKINQVLTETLGTDAQVAQLRKPPKARPEIHLRTYDTSKAESTGFDVTYRNGGATLTWHTCWSRNFVGHVWRVNYPPADVARALASATASNSPTTMRQLLDATLLWLDCIALDCDPWREDAPQMPPGWRLLKRGRRIP